MGQSRFYKKRKLKGSLDVTIYEGPQCHPIVIKLPVMHVRIYIISKSYSLMLPLVVDYSSYIYDASSFIEILPANDNTFKFIASIPCSWQTEVRRTEEVPS